MPRPSNAPRLGEGQEFFLNLYADVAIDLHVYCEVVGSQKTKLINRAVRELIARDLDQNKGFSERFNALKAGRIEEARRRKEPSGPFRVLRSQAGSSATRIRRRKRDQ